MNINSGLHSLYAKAYVENAYETSNTVTVQGGVQEPYLGNPFQIPGIIHAGNFDTFEGGLGQNISYFDTSQDNEGNFRTDEYVDASIDNEEGSIVGWITGGEWLEYTINVINTGTYNLNFRYSSGNPSGGGPFYFELDGERVSANIMTPSTGSWGNWVNKQIDQIALTEGKHILRLIATGGEFNLGEMNFSQTGGTSSDGNASPIVYITSPNSGSLTTTGSNLQINATAYDPGGSITLVEFYSGDTKLGEDTTEPFEINWNVSEIQEHEIKAIATDNEGNKTSSPSINVIAREDNTCSKTSNESIQGEFNEGYSVSYETIGNNVVISFELLDTDKVGVVAYLWQESPFQEQEMERVSDTKFTTTLQNQTNGTILSYACKFAFAGGLGVTKYFNYTVGSDFCSEDDEVRIVSISSPTNGGSFTVGETIPITAELNGFNSSVSKVEFFNGITKIGEDSLEPYQINWNPSQAGTYEIKATATDLDNNSTTSSTVTVTAIEVDDPGNGVIVDDKCNQTSNEASEGSFTEGYSIRFETIDNDVVIEFELLDTDKVGVVAHLFQESPFQEQEMERVSDTKFTTTLQNQMNGTILSYACKFAFAGGLSVTKYFNYEVGTLFCEQDCNNEITLPVLQTLNLPSGWSIFSTYMIPEDPEITKVLDPLVQNDQIIIVKNNTGMAYLPEWNFNAIGDLSIKMGYLIKTTNICTLEIHGSYAIPENFPIEINAGWNTISYLQTEPVDAQIILRDLISTDNLIIAKDYNGNALLPDYNFNGIGTMKAGEGYQLKVLQSTSLNYQSDNPCDTDN